MINYNKSLLYPIITGVIAKSRPESTFKINDYLCSAMKDEEYIYTILYFAEAEGVLCGEPPLHRTRRNDAVKNVKLVLGVSRGRYPSGVKACLANEPTENSHTERSQMRRKVAKDWTKGVPAFILGNRLSDRPEQSGSESQITINLTTWNS